MTDQASQVSRLAQDSTSQAGLGGIPGAGKTALAGIATSRRPSSATTGAKVEYINAKAA